MEKAGDSKHVHWKSWKWKLIESNKYKLLHSSDTMKTVSSYHKIWFYRSTNIYIYIYIYIFHGVYILKHILNVYQYCFNWAVGSFLILPLVLSSVSCTHVLLFLHGRDVYVVIVTNFVGKWIMAYWLLILAAWHPIRWWPISRWNLYMLSFYHSKPCSLKKPNHHWQPLLYLWQ